jgi:hypothetical protein
MEKRLKGEKKLKKRKRKDKRASKFEILNLYLYTRENISHFQFLVVRTHILG